ncbi:MAG: EAL domain-containing protein [Azovibrio sp.]
MPLTDLVRYLNAQDEKTTPDPEQDTPFFFQDGRVFVRFAGLHLGTRFTPIVKAATGQMHGHTAELSAYHQGDNTPLNLCSIFTLPLDDKEFIYLGRLVRTLHVLNYLNLKLKGNLLLKVHPRHVLDVPSEHGLAFETLLHSCGLMPDQITVELEIDNIKNEEHLKQAIANYKRQGYWIAIHRFGRNILCYDLLRKLSPHIVHLDASLFNFPEKLKKVMEYIHALGAQILFGETYSKPTGINNLLQKGCLQIAPCRITSSANTLFRYANAT